MLCFSSCAFQHESKDKAYAIYWQDNSLCVTMPRPTIGVIELGREHWNGVKLSDVADDIYKECSSTEKSENVVVWVRFENPQTDKYGNVTMAYDDFEIATIPLSEARKYKSGKYLDAEYRLTENIRNAAFGSTNNDEYHDSWDNYNEFDRELNDLRNKRYIAPTDTINLDF